MRFLLDTAIFIYLGSNPFDRMIVSVSVCEDLPVMTNDDRFDLYEVRRLW